MTFPVPSNQPPKHDGFLCASARQLLLATRVYLSHETRCKECEGVVRYIGRPGSGGFWLCPMCAVVLPFVHWQIPHFEGLNRVRDADMVIIALPEGACKLCGEGVAPCRCMRQGKDRGEKLPY